MTDSLSKDEKRNMSIQKGKNVNKESHEDLLFRSKTDHKSEQLICSLTSATAALLHYCNACVPPAACSTPPASRVRRASKTSFYLSETRRCEELQLILVE